ncbi:hypothetical protein [Chryseobacterium sp. M5A1_1a]
MKYILHLFIILLVMQSCQSKELKISFKTIEINIPGTLGPSLKHNSKYYCYFKINEDNYFGMNENKLGSVPVINFYILDENGKTQSKIPAPKPNFTDYGLYVRNDSIFTTGYRNYSTFYLDEKNKKWIKIKNTNYIIYKDKNYTLFNRISEFHSNETWLKDNATDQQYKIQKENPIVNKLNNDYYLTTKYSILKIPALKKKQPGDLRYEHGKVVANTNQSLKEPETEYLNEPSTLFNFYIVTSFIINNQLYHLYSEENSMKIAVLKNKELINIQEFKSDIFPYRSQDDTKFSNSEKQYQSFPYSTKDPNFSGMIEIDDNLFNVITFKNLYRETIYGEPKIKAWVEKNFEYFYTNLHTLSIDQVDRIEQKENALDLTQRYSLCSEGCPKEPRLYKKIERKYINLLTVYDYDSDSKAVERIEFEWSHPSWTDFENNDEEFKVFNSLNSKKIFKDKYDRMAGFLKQKLGKPVSEEENEHNTKAKWETKTKSVELIFSSKVTTLTIYKK